MSPARESGSFSPPDQAVSDAPPAQERAENKRETLLEELDRNIGRVLELQTIIKEEISAEKPDAALSRLRDFRESLWAGESDETIQLRDEWKQLTTRSQELKSLDGIRDDKNITKQKDKQLTTDLGEIKTIAKRLAKIEGIDSLSSRLNLDQQVTVLEEKANRVVRYTSDQEQLLRDATDALGHAIPTSSVREYVYDTFGITLVMDPKFIDKEYEDGTTGFHSYGSPFSFVADQGPDTEWTIEHERSHNIVDASVIEHGDPGSLLERQYQSLLYKIKNWTPGVIRNADEERRLLLDSIQQPGFRVLDTLHDELLAASSNLQDELQKNRDMLLDNNLIKYPLTKSPAFELFVNESSTAGWEAGVYAKTLETIAEKTTTEDWSDPELAAAAAKASDDFGASLSTMLKHVVEVGELSKQYGPAAERDAQAALYVLRPSKYRHIPELLKHKYGSNTAGS